MSLGLGAKRAEEELQRQLRALQREKDNNRCFHCESRGAPYVVFFKPGVRLFVCTDCGAEHRNFPGHRLKSVSAAKFDATEVDALKEGANGLMAATYLAKYDQSCSPRRPQRGDAHAVKTWIHVVFEKRKFFDASGAARYRRDSSSTVASGPTSRSDRALPPSAPLPPTLAQQRTPPPIAAAPPPRDLLDFNSPTPSPHKPAAPVPGAWRAFDVATQQAKPKRPSPEEILAMQMQQLKVGGAHAPRAGGPPPGGSAPPASQGAPGYPAPVGGAAQAAGSRAALPEDMFGPARPAAGAAGPLPHGMFAAQGGAAAHPGMGQAQPAVPAQGYSGGPFAQPPGGAPFGTPPGGLAPLGQPAASANGGAPFDSGPAQGGGASNLAAAGLVGAGAFSLAPANGGMAAAGASTGGVGADLFSDLGPKLRNVNPHPGEVGAPAARGGVVAAPVVKKPAPAPAPAPPPAVPKSGNPFA
ncbi:unnamed protein product [Pedinophyceae sp. YPF-701]|nr:unnamed protein product [Pedinophyceae sp. YPF-701]